MKEAEALARWNTRYAQADYLFGMEPNAFLASQAPRIQAMGLKPGRKALSIADGEGRNGVFLARQGLSVLSVDFSPVALEKAKSLAARAGVELATECADLATWDWGSGRFDVVAGIFFQFAGADLRDSIFRRIGECLKPGGMLILQGYRPEQLKYGTGGPKEIDHLYTAQLLRRAFAGFELLHLEEHDSEIHEGGGHHGMSALVDMVAIKPMARL
jgi:cyclopropane fatty-acyl-phospholipid synthase-like methyltransferase